MCVRERERYIIYYIFCVCVSNHNNNNIILVKIIKFSVADLIPDNNTKVTISQLPATFHCEIMDTTEMLNMEIVTEWYINGIPYREFPHPAIAEYVMTDMEGMETNITIASLSFIRSPVPFVELSCRTSVFPDVVYGLYEIGKKINFKLESIILDYNNNIMHTLLFYDI